jgi:Protein of unknown function (DUF4058)
MMPSPFPGMDPYLEHPRRFPNLHGDLITFLKGALQTQMPEPYYASSDARVWLEYSQRYVEPDVSVLRSDPGPLRGAAVAALPAEPVIVKVETVFHDDRQEPFLEIYAGAGEEARLVTSIEILSPTNKTPGERAREMYLSKQQELLAGQAHLVEIDLLRGGQHATAVPRDLAIKRAGPFDYHVSVHRFDRPGDYFVYPIQLSQRLPTIAVPLLPGDPDVPLDLQAAFDRAYDIGPYRRSVRYGRDPIVPPLRPDQEQWAAQALGAGR